MLGKIPEKKSNHTKHEQKNDYFAPKSKDYQNLKRKTPRRLKENKEVYEFPYPNGIRMLKPSGRRVYNLGHF